MVGCLAHYLNFSKCLVTCLALVILLTHIPSQPHMIGGTLDRIDDTEVIKVARLVGL